MTIRVSLTILTLLIAGAARQSQAQNVFIPDSNFKAALVGNTAINTNNDDEIQIEEAANYMGLLNIQGKNIFDLTGIEAFTRINFLDCSNNQLTRLDISQNTNLFFLNCMNNRLTSLLPLAFSPPDLPPYFPPYETPIMALTDLLCAGNQLSNLDISRTVNLRFLDCSNNQLFELIPLSLPYPAPFMPNMPLTDLRCTGNQLTNLDISQASNLRFLDCSFNRLTNLYPLSSQSPTMPPFLPPYTTNQALTDLYCIQNQLTVLDFSQYTNLMNLDCSSNQLSSLNVKNGNNFKINQFNASSNYYLTCIQVDDASWSNTHWPQYYSMAGYSENCSSSFLNIKVYLEGDFDPLSGIMSGKMNTPQPVIPLEQPFNISPWDYTGTESVFSIPSEIIDWVLVELRQADTPELATSSTILAKRAAFLKSDGSIVDLDGTRPVQFENTTAEIGKNLYVVVRHRNHLAVMSAFGANPINGIYIYDFTTDLTQTFGGGNGYKQIGSAYAMVVGDIDQDGNIFVSDYNSWAVEFGATNGYFNADLDMDGNVFVSDYNKWAVNFGAIINDGLKSAQTKSKYFSCVPK